MEPTPDYVSETAISVEGSPLCAAPFYDSIADVVAQAERRGAARTQNEGHDLLVSYNPANFPMNGFELFFASVAYQPRTGGTFICSAIADTPEGAILSAHAKVSKHF